MYMAGVMIGSPLTGMASDHFGRRAILLCCLLLSSVLSLLVLFVRNVFGAISVRFIIGFFISVSIVGFFYKFCYNDLYSLGKTGIHGLISCSRSWLLC